MDTSACAFACIAGKTKFSRVSLQDIKPLHIVSQQARDELTERLDRFHDQVIKVSRDTTAAELRRAQRMHAAESIPIQ